MIDPASVLITGVLFGAGWLAGRIGRRRGTPRPVKPICSCGHGLAMHDKPTDTCHATVEQDRYTALGSHAGFDHVQCACRRYVGPEHIADVWAPPAIDQ